MWVVQRGLLSIWPVGLQVHQGGLEEGPPDPRDKGAHQGDPPEEGDLPKPPLGRNQQAEPPRPPYDGQLPSERFNKQTISCKDCGNVLFFLLHMNFFFSRFQFLLVIIV